MRIPSYEGRTYVVMDNDARIRRADDLAVAEKYRAGDALPAGAT